MEQTHRSSESEGFRAHIYLKQKRQGWSYVVSSKLARVLAEEDLTWKTVKVVTHERYQPPPTQLKFEFNLEQLFQSLAKWWSQDTQHMSNLIKACNHPAYQQIIGMGKIMPGVIIPLILRELKHRPDHWFWALHEITNQDPAQPEADFEGAVEAWLSWGQQNQYL